MTAAWHGDISHDSPDLIHAAGRYKAGARSDGPRRPGAAVASRTGRAPVLRTLESELDDTILAERPITVEDVLSFHLGFGSIMAPGPFPIQRAESELDLKTLPSAPDRPRGRGLAASWST
jgi:hypothetical protein